ncbi:hypothetical protein ACIDOF_22945, partial [Streptomyces sp. Da 82-17]
MDEQRTGGAGRRRRHAGPPWLRPRGARDETGHATDNAPTTPAHPAAAADSAPDPAPAGPDHPAPAAPHHPGPA